MMAHDKLSRTDAEGVARFIVDHIIDVDEIVHKMKVSTNLTDEAVQAARYEYRRRAVREAAIAGVMDSLIMMSDPDHYIMCYQDNSSADRVVAAFNAKLNGRYPVKNRQRTVVKL